MSFIKLDPQPAPRAAGLDYETIAPGLYPDETAVQLDSGELVAVAIEAVTWLENGAGVAMVAVARLIGADGATAGAVPGQHLETKLPHTASPVEIDQFGLPAVQKEMLLAVLGEPATIVTRNNPPPPDPANPPDGWTETFDAPMILWPEEVRLNVSIRHALVSATAAAVELDPGAILGL